ncbi:MAG: ABC transporter substrate-binding protein [Haloferacaceae archaeon]
MRNRRAFLAAAGSAIASTSGCLSTAGLNSVTGGDELRLTYDGAPPHFQAVVMQRESMFDAIPAAVTTEEGGCKSIVQMLVTEKADVGMTGIIPALTAIDRGPPLSIVAASSREAFVVMAHEDLADRYESDGGEGWAEFAEDAGGTVKLATYPEGSVSDITARHWLEETLDSPGETVELVPLAGPGAARQALIAGEVDGAVIPEPTPTLVETRGAPYRRIGWVGEFIPGQPAGVVLVRDAFAEENPAAVEGFLDRHRAATEFVNSRPEPSAEYMSDVYGGEGALDPETALKALRSRATQYVTDPATIAEGTDVMAEYAARFEKTQEVYDADDLIDPKYYEAVTE